MFNGAKVALEQSETTNSMARSIEEINTSYQAMNEITQTSANLTHLAEQQGQLVHRFTL